MTVAIVFGTAFLFSKTALAEDIPVHQEGYANLPVPSIVVDKTLMKNKGQVISGNETYTVKKYTDIFSETVGIDKSLSAGEHKFNAGFSVKYPSSAYDQDNNFYDVVIDVSNIVIYQDTTRLQNWYQLFSLYDDGQSVDSPTLIGARGDLGDGRASSAQMDVKISLYKTGTNELASGSYIFYIDNLNNPSHPDNSDNGPWAEAFQLLGGNLSDIYVPSDTLLAWENNRFYQKDRLALGTSGSGRACGLAFLADASNTSFHYSSSSAMTLLFYQGTSYTINATADEGGIISPEGESKVNPTWNKTYTISADDKHIVEDVLVDDKSIGAVDTYTFEKVDADHTIHVKVVPAVNVNFVDEDGTVLKTDKIKVGSDATAPSDPSKPYKKFVGWDKPFSGVETDLTVTALYEDIPVNVKYTMRTGDEEGTELSFGNYKSNAGQKITETGVPQVHITDGWVLDGFYIGDKKYSKTELADLVLEEDVVVEIRAFPDKIGNSNTDNPADPKNTVETPDGVDDRTQAIVTFVDEDGSILNKQVVDLGDDAKAPTDPAQSNKTFVGWDKAFDKIKENLTVVAQYKAEESVPTQQSSQQPQIQNPSQQPSSVQQVAAAASEMIAKTGDNMFAIVLGMMMFSLAGCFAVRRMK